MKLVVDSNVLFAAFIRDSTSRKIVSHLEAEFFIISTNYDELEEHKKELRKKAKMDALNFEILIEKIVKKCIFIEDKKLVGNWQEAIGIMDKIDPNDTAFIAAALATGADIWSDDPHFAKQKKIKIWKTSDLAKLV